MLRQVHILTDFHVENDEKGFKFKVGDHVTIWKSKNVSAKAYIPNSSNEVLVIKIVKNIVPWTYCWKYRNS